MPYFLLTTDVELISIPFNREVFSLAKKIYKVAIPMLLDLYSKYNVKSTFYFTGNFVEIEPAAVEIVKKEGHEIGCHGYSHNAKNSLDILSYEEQLQCLTYAKNILESVAGRVTSFRAPALRINAHTIRVLEKLDFKTDSSVASQRFDGPFSLGTKEKIGWLFAPRSPYYPSYDSPFKMGKSSVLEIPISAIIIPYIGTTMRISPFITRIIEKFLFMESFKTGKPIVFIIHPNECLTKNDMEVDPKEVPFIPKKWVVDVLKPKLKCRNLGTTAINLLETIIKKAKSYGFKFATVIEFYNHYKKEHK